MTQVRKINQSAEETCFIAGFLKSLAVFFSAVCCIVYISCSSGSGDKVNDTERIYDPHQVEFSIKMPGKWKGLENEHVPSIKIYEDKTKDNIVIHVNLKSRSNTHYIERIGVMDAKGKDLAGQDIVPGNSNTMVKAVLTLDPVPTDPKVKVYVKCSTHDMWTAPLR